MSGQRYVTLEGVVKHLGEKSVWFRETDAEHDICIPLSQIRDGESVKTGDIQIDVTSWFLGKLDDEGKR